MLSLFVFRLITLTGFARPNFEFQSSPRESKLKSCTMTFSIDAIRKRLSTKRDQIEHTTVEY